jgi:hypothetical protein
MRASQPKQEHRLCWKNRRPLPKGVVSDPWCISREHGKGVAAAILPLMAVKIHTSHRLEDNAAAAAFALLKSQEGSTSGGFKDIIHPFASKG